MQSRVDFAYAFAPPHRLTVARPDSSEKTLLDLQSGYLRLAWTTDDLRRFPLAAFATPRTDWDVRLQPELDGHPFAHSTWRRLDGCLPVLENDYRDARGAVRLQVAGGATAAIVRVEVTNTGDRTHQFSVCCERPGALAPYNPGWVDPAADRDVLLAGWQDRADRVVLLGLGGEECAVVSANGFRLTWNLAPGEQATGWVIRPYRAYAADLPGLRDHDWAGELAAAVAEWRALLARGAQVRIPDPGVQQGFLACLADLYIMREPVADGYLARVPGTEAYRAPNSGEPLVVSVALDQLGRHEDAAITQRLCFDLQGDDGCWDDPQGWGHLMWGLSGFKAWAVSEHYRLTGDRGALEEAFPRLAAASRWRERQRARTRVLVDGQRPLTYGLMPRGFGDCGLKNDDDLYGVFLPHNFWAVFADRVAVEAAEALGKTEELPELRAIYETARADLLQALEAGAIPAEGYRWIPGVPGKTSGSRWGALNALFPCRLLPADHELITGTLRHLEQHLSPGGLHVNTGWMPDGMWVAISLDNVAEAHLVRGEGDVASELLYAALNHGTPLYTWCEERGQVAGTDQCSGDRQHLWTPVAVVRCVRDCLVMEEGEGLHLARGAARGWLASGEPVGIEGAATHFGPVSYTLQYDPGSARVTGRVCFQADRGPDWAVLHLRLPAGLRVASVSAESGAVVLPDGSGLRWEAPRGELRFTALVAEGSAR